VIGDHHQRYCQAVRAVFPEATHLRTGLHRASGETTRRPSQSSGATSPLWIASARHGGSRRCPPASNSTRASKPCSPSAGGTSRSIAWCLPDRELAPGAGPSGGSSRARSGGTVAPGRLARPAKHRRLPAMPSTRCGRRLPRLALGNTQRRELLRTTARWSKLPRPTATSRSPSPSKTSWSAGAAGLATANCSKPSCGLAPVLRRPYNRRQRRVVVALVHRRRIGAGRRPGAPCEAGRRPEWGVRMRPVGVRPTGCPARSRSRRSVERSTSGQPVRTGAARRRASCAMRGERAARAHGGSAPVPGGSSAAPR
jgi:hypothetical protein